MIVFDLKCGGGHVFEAWFSSSEAYEGQRAGGHVVCPVCQDGMIEKAVMAPAISPKGNQRVSRRDRAERDGSREESGSVAAPSVSMSGLPSDIPAPLAEALTRLAQAQMQAISQSRWVGGKFAEEARAMHYGEREHAMIHGTASLDDAREMLEEGVSVVPLLVPVAPPDQVN